MAEGAVLDTSTIDLSEDLYCAVLFQPLTLLDCMHTFCGACLKDWFAHQAASARSLHPYTCPSCRDSVRSTARHPFVRNTLEKHMKRHPELERTAEDKKEHIEKYTPGDNVMPKLRLRNPPPDEEDDRLMDEVMQMSLREAGIEDNPPPLSPPPPTSSLQPTDNRRQGQGSSRGGSRSRTSSRSPGRRSTEGTREPAPVVTSPPPPSSSTQQAARTRQIEHQSSLISLLSVSEMDPEDMQQEITRMIAQEGLLDDVDLSNLDATREEELSERIAAAYRRRKEEARLRRREAEVPRERSRQRDRSNQRAPNSRASSRPGTEENPARQSERRRTGGDARPPISNPQLIDSANQGQTRHRRTGSSGSSRTTVRTDSGIATASPTLAPILPTGPPTGERRRRQSNERSATDPSRVPVVSQVPQTSGPGSAPTTPRNTEMSLAPHRTHIRQRSDSNPQRSPRLGTSSTFPRTNQNRSTSSLPIGLNHSTTDPSSIQQPPSGALNPPATSGRPSSSSSASAQSRPALHVEPNISCSKCSKEHIEYDVHYNCPKCSTENQPYNLCKACFRQGVDNCKGWLGFGSAAMREYESRIHAQPQLPSSLEKPHIFTAHRYARPRHPLVPGPTSDRPHRQLTDEDPAKRQEKGVFCDLCSAYANHCYWKCDACNDGEWGFCNSCVNQGKHCTHPLLPLKAREDEHEHEQATTSQVDGHLSAPIRPEAEQQPSPPLTPKSASIIDGPVVIPVANLPFQPLTFHTLCDICTNPIPPSVTRFHCPQCNGGDYDICKSCYHGLVATGKISTANGPQGWRRCPQNHRMVIIGFQDAGGGQRRVVDRDLVGGWTFFDEPRGSNATTAGTRKWRWTGDNGQEEAADPEHRTRMAAHVRTPPDGGIGLVFYGRWNYFPENASEKDLCFPKGAEIREAEDINGEWLWGVYAGKTGLFFAPYVNFLRKVGV